MVKFDTTIVKLSVQCATFWRKNCNYCYYFVTYKEVFIFKSCLKTFSIFLKDETATGYHVWKFLNFSAPQIFRENKLCKFIGTRIKMGNIRNSSPGKIDFTYLSDGKILNFPHCSTNLYMLSGNWPIFGSKNQTGPIFGWSRMDPYFTRCTQTLWVRKGWSCS